MALAAAPVFIAGFIILQTVKAGMEKEITDKNHLLSRSLSSEMERLFE